MNYPVIGSSTEVLNTKFFSVYDAHLRDHNNKDFLQTIVVRKPIVCIIPFKDQKSLYMIKQFRSFFGSTIYELPAGHSEEGEDPLEAAKRELEEETGIRAKKWHSLFTMYSSASVIFSPVHFFIATDISLGEAHPDDEEDISLTTVSLSHALELVSKGQITTATTIMGLFFAEKYMQGGFR